MAFEEDDDRRDLILDYISDLISNFLYYDRKEDEDLPLGAIEESIKAGEITVDEMVTAFRKGLETSLQ